LATACGAVHIVEGRFQQKPRQCRKCRASWVDHEEKETDVSIAVALLEDAVNDVFDAALLISADSDLCPAVRALGRLRPTKRVIAAFPPARSSGDLRRAVNGAAFTIGHANIRNSLLPNTVTTASGTSSPGRRTGADSSTALEGMAERTGVLVPLGRSPLRICSTNRPLDPTAPGRPPAARSRRDVVIPRSNACRTDSSTCSG
jgi:hypothetical protein